MWPGTPPGNIFVSDGYGNSRVVKYDKNGRFITSVGSKGSAPGQFNLPHTIAADAKGNVYVGDRSNRRIQVFDNDLKFKAIYDQVGAPWAVCITPGPHQYLYSSNSNPDNNIADIAAVTGEIYKMELDGTILGKFGKAGKQLGEFSTVHEIDCRNENELLVSEITAWRVQKITAAPKTELEMRMGATSMTRYFRILRMAASLLCAGSLPAPGSVPEIPYDSAPNLLKLPEHIHLGEAVGVATNSKGHIFVYTRTGSDQCDHRRLADFHARRRAAVRVRPRRQIRPRDRPGRVRVHVCARRARRSAGQHLGGRRRVEHGHQVQSRGPRGDDDGPEAGGGSGSRARCASAAAAAQALPATISTGRPTWPGTRPEIFSSPTAMATRGSRSSTRTARFIKSWGSRGTEPGQFNTPHSIAIDAQGNVYVGDRGNKRIQVFDNDGNFKTQYTNVGAPWAVCISPGRASVSVQLELERHRLHGQRRDLQDGAGRAKSSASSARRASC